MASFQYYVTSSPWVDVPKEAYQGTYEGDFTLQYPLPEAFDGTGRRCAAVGRPTLRLKSTIMTACGMKFWQNTVQTAASVQDTLIGITAVNPYTGAWAGYTGYAERPTWGRVSHGSASGNTFYYDVTVVINELTTACWPSA